MAIEFKSVFGNTDKETLAGLRDKFKNTALWDYLPVAIPFFFHEVNSWEEELSKDTRSGVQKYIDETLELVQLLRSLKLGKAKGTGWRLESRSDIQRLYDSVESLFFEKLDNLTHVLHKYEWEDYSSELFSDWEEALSAFPRTELFQKEDRETDEVNIEMEDGKPRLSIDEIESAIITIKKCKKIADSISSMENLGYQSMKSNLPSLP